MTTLFTKIANREIPSKVIFEDELCMAIEDIHPKAPTHVLLFPKKEIPSLADATPADAELLGHMLAKIPEITQALKLDRGFRVVINTKGDAGQEVPHLHLHILGGRKLSWPPG